MPEKKSPSSHPSVAVIIPVFNEKINILTTLVSELRHFAAVIIVVDDGSHPPISKISDDVILIRHKENLGQGASLETGMEYARRNKFDIVVHMDGDGQHQAKEIPLLLAPIIKNEADIVFGSRFLTRTSEQMIPVARRNLLQVSRLANMFFTGARMTDAHNGFRAMNSKALHALKLRSTGRTHASEIVWLARKSNLRIIEVPVHILYDDAAENKIPLTTLIELAFHLTWSRMTGYRSVNKKAVIQRQAVLEEIKLLQTIE